MGRSAFAPSSLRLGTPSPAHPFSGEEALSPILASCPIRRSCGTPQPLRIFSACLWFSRADRAEISRRSVHECTEPPKEQHLPARKTNPRNTAFASAEILFLHPWGRAWCAPGVGYGVHQGRAWCAPGGLSRWFRAISPHSRGEEAFNPVQKATARGLLPTCVGRRSTKEKKLSSLGRAGIKFTGGASVESFLGVNYEDRCRS